MVRRCRAVAAGSLPPPPPPPLSLSWGTRVCAHEIACEGRHASLTRSRIVGVHYDVRTYVRTGVVSETCHECVYLLVQTSISAPTRTWQYEQRVMLGIATIEGDDVSNKACTWCCCASKSAVVSTRSKSNCEANACKNRFGSKCVRMKRRENMCVWK